MINKTAGADGGRKVEAGAVFNILFLATILLVIFYPETLRKYRVNVGGIGFTPLTTLAPFTILAFLWFAVTRARELRPRLFDLFFLGAMTYIFIHTAMIAEASLELRLAGQYAGLGIAMYYGAALLMKDSGRLTALIRVMVIALGVVSAYEIVSTIIQSDPIYGGIDTRDPSYFRGGSTLLHPVYLGGYLLQAIPFALYAMFFDSSARFRRFAQVTLVLTALAALFSFSKGLWIIGSVEILALAIIMRGEVMPWVRRHLIAVAGVAFMLLFITSVLLVRGDLRYQMFERELDPFYGRQWTWSAAVDTIAEDPFPGAGLFRGNYAIFDATPATAEPERRYWPVDNSYLAIAVEQGIPGALLYGGALLMVVVASIRITLRKGTKDRYLAMMLTFSILGIMADAVIFDAFIIWPPFIIFWSVAGVVRALQERDGKCVQNSRQLLRRSRETE